MRSPLIDRLIEKQGKNPIILGHRGIRGNIPENTLPAFKEAFRRGALGIEIDVESTLDGKLIVVNRWFLKSQFGIFPWENTLENIQGLGRKKGIEIPTFFESCRFMSENKNTIFNVEIKSSHPFICHTARKAMGIIRHYGLDARVIVSSFDINTLLTARLFHPTIETAYLFRSVDRVTNLKKKNTWRYKISSSINRTGIKGFLPGVDTLHPEITLFPENANEGERLWMKAARRMGKRVNTWTVDNKKDLSKAVGAGVGMVISDSVDKIV